MDLLTLFEVYILWIACSYKRLTSQHWLAVTSVFSLFTLYLNASIVFIQSMRVHLFLDIVLMISIIALLTLSFKANKYSFQDAMLVAGGCLLLPVFLKDLMVRDIIPLFESSIPNAFVITNSDLFSFGTFIIISIVIMYLINAFNLKRYVFQNRVGNTLFSITILVLLTIRLPTDYLTFGNKLTFLEILVSTVVVFVLIFLIFKILKKYDDDLQQAQYMKKQQDINLANQLYVSEMENSYRNIRKIQHDYDNHLLVLNQLIRNNHISDAQTYLMDITSNTDMSSSKASPYLMQLHRINNNDIKNVMLVKLSNLSEHIQLKLEVPDDISISTDSSSTITRSMGIMLDNAIEALDTLSAGTLSIAIIKKSDSFIFEISNTCSPSTHPIHELMKLHYSTKGTDRGYGLNNLHDIIENTSNMFLDTNITQQIFTHTLILITDNGEHDETHFDL